MKLRGKEKDCGKTNESHKNDAAIKRTEKILKRYRNRRTEIQERVIPRTKTKNITRQQLLYHGLNKKCNAALRIIKMDTAAKLSSERQNDAAAVQTAEIPEKYRRNPELRKIKKGAADIKNYRMQRVETINTAECQITERGTRYRKTKKNFRNLTKMAKLSKYAK
jgi:hypothetical protein